MTILYCVVLHRERVLLTVLRRKYRDVVSSLTALCADGGPQLPLDLRSIPRTLPGPSGSEAHTQVQSVEVCLSSTHWHA